MVEYIGSADAETLLKEWAKGVAEASLTREARVALQRLDRRRNAKP